MINILKVTEKHVKIHQLIESDNKDSQKFMEQAMAYE